LLAHEINHSLQAIHNSLRLVRTAPLQPEEEAEFLQMADEEVERLIGIVTRILEFARPSQRDKQPTDVNDAVEKSLALTHKHLQHQAITLQADLSPGLPPIAATSDELPGAIRFILSPLL
jgi:two-component system sensor kinase FixL